MCKGTIHEIVNFKTPPTSLEYEILVLGKVIILRIIIRCSLGKFSRSFAFTCLILCTMCCNEKGGNVIG